MILAKKFYALKNVTYYYRITNKSKIMNERRVIDIYKGILECLNIAKSNNLNRLYNEVLSHLNSQFVLEGAKKYMQSGKLKIIISRILNSIDFDVLSKENSTFIKNPFYELFK